MYTTCLTLKNPLHFAHVLKVNDSHDKQTHYFPEQHGPVCLYIEKLCVCYGVGIFKFLSIGTYMSGYKMLSPTVIVIRKFEIRMNV